jgi:hypothetical protein
MHALVDRSPAVLMALALATQASALIAAAIPAAQAQAAPSTPLGCPAPQLGGYVVMGQGSKGGTPLAELAQERWLPNGRIEGVRFSRQGKLFAEQRYLASYAVMPGCWVAVQRADRSGLMPAQVALDGAGRPKVGISTTAGVVFTSQYLPQPERPCTVSQLDGLVISQQQGFTFQPGPAKSGPSQSGSWQPNAVIQREQWRGGKVSGLAVSSYGGKREQAPYTGSLTLEADCLGRLREVDGLGGVYNYRVVLLASGAGYLYIQSDPADLTVGYLAHQRP